MAHEQPPQQVQRIAGKAVLVLQLRQAVAVGLVLPRHQRVGEVGAGGVVLAVVAVLEVKRPGAARHAHKKLFVALAVQAGGHAGHASGAKLGKAVFTARQQGRGRDQHIDAVVQALAPGDAPLAQRLRALPGGGQLGAVHVAAAPRDHVDHAKHGVLAIHRTARAGDELDALDQVDVDRQIPAAGPGVGLRGVDPIAVDGDQRPGVVVARQAEAAHADIAVLAVVAGVHTRQAGQRLGQRAPAKGADLLPGDHAHRRRHLALLLLVFGRADDGHFHQLIQAE